MKDIAKPIALWDIDNCLADDSWRHPLIEWDKGGNERYDKYNERMLQDPSAHEREFHFMSRFTQPIFFTGRTEKWRTLTTRWLCEQLGCRTPTIYMRHNDEGGTPAAVKFRMLRELKTTRFLGHLPIIAAFDDLPAVVDMYRRAGIPACQLAIYEDVSKVYTPSDLQPLTP